MGAPAAGRQAAQRRAARQGQPDLCRRDRLSGVEDQSPRGNEDRDQALAAPLAARRRADARAAVDPGRRDPLRSEEHTSELQSLMRSSYAVFCLKNKQTYKTRLKEHKN